MIETNSILEKIKDLNTRYNQLLIVFDYEIKKERLIEVVKELEQSEVWSDPKRAQELGKERVQLENIVINLDKVVKQLADTEELLELSISEKDIGSIEEISKDIIKIEKIIEELEFKRMFSGKMDSANAFLDIQSGSGGTEAQDWAEMLLRMYLRWSERHGFKVTLIERTEGDVAGIKGATIKVEGEYAYGWLRTESGIHRLVRKSPFDSNNKRHTSFASIFIYPEVTDDINIEINPADLRIDTYRASGAGGQHVNKTDSAVRITHIPTNTVVQCQSDRSQHKNKAQAMSTLKSKLYELEMSKRTSDKQALEDTKSDIGWGSQIRSYVLDQSRVKDLRTNLENTDPNSVLDGKLDPFIEASLKDGY